MSRSRSRSYSSEKEMLEDIDPKYEKINRKIKKLEKLKTTSLDDRQKERISIGIQAITAMLSLIHLNKTREIKDLIYETINIIIEDLTFNEYKQYEKLVDINKLLINDDEIVLESETKDKIKIIIEEINENIKKMESMILLELNWYSKLTDLDENLKKVKYDESKMKLLTKMRTRLENVDLTISNKVSLLKSIAQIAGIDGKKSRRKSKKKSTRRRKLH